MTETRSSSALFKRAEQLKRWEESDTNKQRSTPKQPSRIRFSSGIVFLAACTAGDKDEVLRLLASGADINTSNVDGLTALHQACIDDNLEMVEFLVTHGADVNRGDNEGWTPLHATASCGFLSIARYLLESGADVGAVNYDGELALDLAESDAMEQMLQKAVEEKGVDCDKSRNAEVCALMRDAKEWAMNEYVDVRDPKTGGTPLHVCAAKGYTDVAKVLLEECNVDPDSVDYEGWTPLHAAALWGQKEAVALLIKYGADADVKNYSGQTCYELVDPSIADWLASAVLKIPKRPRNNNNNKRKRSPPKLDVKRGSGQTDNTVNDKPPPTPEIIPKASEAKPPKARAPSPEPNEQNHDDEAPSWRRSASLKSRQIDVTRENSKPPVTNNNQENDTLLRRTHSFENDKAFYQRYRDVTARIKATSCPSIPPAPQRPDTNHADTNEDDSRVSPTDRKERDESSWNSQNTNSQTTVRSASESPSEGSLSTVSTPSAATPTKLSPGNIFKNFFKSFVPPVKDEESETQRKAHAKRVRETRRSTQGVTLDEIKSAEQLVKKKPGNDLETPPPPAPLKKPDIPIAETAFELEDAARTPNSRPAVDATITLRRPPPATTPLPPVANDEKVAADEDKDRESGDSKSSNTSPSSAQAALNVIQRRRRPKRRSTGVGNVDMDDIVNDKGAGEEESESAQSGSERTADEGAPDGSPDYKALYEASDAEVKRLRALLNTSEQQLREARTTISRLTVNQNAVSETEKREKRAMERKLSEMEEELRFHQAVQAENQRLKDENGALIRVISKLSK